MKLPEGIAKAGTRTSAGRSFGDSQPFPTSFMKNLRVSWLPNHIPGKISRHFADEACLCRDKSNLIAVPERPIALKAALWFCEAIDGLNTGFSECCFHRLRPQRNQVSSLPSSLRKQTNLSPQSALASIILSANSSGRVNITSWLPSISTSLCVPRREDIPG